MAYQPDLAKAFRFDADELAANQRGELTESHKRKILRSFRLETGLSLVITAFTFCFMFILAWSVRVTWRDGSVVIILGGMVFVTVMLWHTRRIYRRIQHDLQASVVRMEGMIQKRHYFRSAGQGGYVEYRVCIGDSHFIISHRLYKVLHDGAWYTLFYLPATRAVISAIKHPSDKFI